MTPLLFALALLDDPADPSPPPPPPPVEEPAPPPAPVVVAPPPPPAPVVVAPPAPKRDRFTFALDDTGATTLHVGAIVQFDGRFFVDDHPQLVDQFAFRSIRPVLDATIDRHLDVRVLPDFAGGKLVVQEAYADARYLGDALVVRAGKLKVPFGLERLQAEVATTFVERGFPTQLAPNRDLGVELYGALAGRRVEYQFGIFNGVADGQSGDGDVGRKKELAARVWLAPIEGLGIGGAVTYGYKLGTAAQPDVAGFKTQGQNTFFAYKTGTSLADTVIADGLHWRATGQAAYYGGPFGALAEYVRSTQHLALAGDHATAAFEAWQVLAQWVVTGERATYKSVTPRAPFDPAKGTLGAVDVAVRATALRAADTAIFDLGYADVAKSAKRAYSAGGGVDWFLSKELRVALDLDHTWFRRGGADGANRAAETSVIFRVQAAY